MIASFLSGALKTLDFRWNSVQRTKRHGVQSPFKTDILFIYLLIWGKRTEPGQARWQKYFSEDISDTLKRLCNNIALLWWNKNYNWGFSVMILIMATRLGRIILSGRDETVWVCCGRTLWTGDRQHLLISLGSKCNSAVAYKPIAILRKAFKMTWKSCKKTSNIHKAIIKRLKPTIRD